MWTSARVNMCGVACGRCVSGLCTNARSLPDDRGFYDTRLRAAFFGQCLSNLCRFARPLLGAVGLLMTSAAQMGAQQQLMLAALQQQIQNLKDQKRLVNQEKKLKKKRDARLVERAQKLTAEDMITMLVIFL